VARKARLAEGSTRDLDWQLAEYRRLMGDEAAERQMRAAGQCTCRARTVKTGDGYRRVHDQDCTKWKNWMTGVVRLVQ
jgi:hypothetical protein